jgi:hypothetical protein
MAKILLLPFGAATLFSRTVIQEKHTQQLMFKEYLNP